MCLSPLCKCWYVDIQKQAIPAPWPSPLLHHVGLSHCRYIEIFKSSRNEIRAYYEVPRRGMCGQRPGPYDRPMMAGPRGGFLTAGPGRGGTLMDTMRAGGGYGGGRQGRCLSWTIHSVLFNLDFDHFETHRLWFCSPYLNVCFILYPSVILYLPFLSRVRFVQVMVALTATTVSTATASATACLTSELEEIEEGEVKSRNHIQFTCLMD